MHATWSCPLSLSCVILLKPAMTFLQPTIYLKEIRLISLFFILVWDISGTSRRFSPSLSTLGSSKGFSARDVLLIFLFSVFYSTFSFSLWFFFLFCSWCRWSGDRYLLHYQYWLTKSLNELFLGKGFIVDLQYMPIDEDGDGFFINCPNKDWTIFIACFHCIWYQPSCPQLALEILVSWIIQQCPIFLLKFIFFEVLVMPYISLKLDYCWMEKGLRSLFI